MDFEIEDVEDQELQFLEFSKMVLEKLQSGNSLKVEIERGAVIYLIENFVKIAEKYREDKENTETITLADLEGFNKYLKGDN